MAFNIPIPSAAETKAGFAAIFQFRWDVVERTFWSDVAGRARLNIDVPFNSVTLPAALQKELDERLRATKPTLENPLGIGRYIPIGWKLEITPRSCLPEPAGASLNVAASWRVRLSVSAYSPGRSGVPLQAIERLRQAFEGAKPRRAALGGSTPRLDGRVGVSSRARGFGGIPPVPSPQFPTFPEIELPPFELDWDELVKKFLEQLGEPGSPQSIQIGEGTIAATGRATPRGKPSAGDLWVDVSFDTQPRWDVKDKWIDTIATQDVGNTALGNISSILSSAVQATPRVSLFCTARVGERVLGVVNDNLVAVATEGNVSGTNVMSLCVQDQFGPNDGSGVKPFIGDNEFAYAVTEPVIHSIVKHCWKRDDFPKQIVGPVAFKYEEQEGATATGSADVQVTLDDLQEVGWDPKLRPSGDAIVFRGEHTTRVLEIRDAGGTAFPKEKLGDLLAPLKEPYEFFLFPFDFDEDHGAGAPQAQKLRQEASTQILMPILQPFKDALLCKEITGFSSAAAGVVVLRSNLSN